MTDTSPTPSNPSEDATTAVPAEALASETSAASAASTGEPAPPRIERRRQRMVPRLQADDTSTTVNRNVLAAARSSVKPQTRRNRQLVGTLPAWDPLPPGEVLVSKPRTSL